MSKILLLEDDLSLINGLSFAFKKHGFELNIARTLKEADALWADGKYDLLVLDVSLPDGTGFEFCKRVRQISKVPIIFLTASDEETSIIMGLDMGGDDYITKPFSLQEVLARIKAVLRRNEGEEMPDILRLGDLRVDPTRKTAYLGDEEIYLSPKEFGILLTLARQPGRVFSREEIMAEVWRGESYVLDRTIDVHIARIRRKLGKEAYRLINRPGYGYSLND